MVKETGLEEKVKRSSRLNKIVVGLGLIIATSLLPLLQGCTIDSVYIRYDSTPYYRGYYHSYDGFGRFHHHRGFDRCW